MTSPSLDRLRTFVTVYRVGSFTQAALLLGISQPTTTAHMRSLEATLGYSLFTRTRTGVTPTEKATELARDLAGHIDALDDIVTSKSIGERARRTIYLGGPAEFLTAVILPQIAPMASAVRAPLHIIFGLPEDMLDSLRVGRLDVVVSSTRPRVRGVESIPLYDEEFTLVAAPSWADAAHTGESLAKIPVVAYADDMPIVRRYWRTVFNRRPSDLQLAAVIPDLRAIRVALISGLGMSVLPLYLIHDELRSGALVSLFEPQVPPLNTVYVAFREGELSRYTHLIAQLRHAAESVGKVF